ncbi:type II toxin-antitoxin system RelE/ParE family toxin [Duganella aceris]|uniref:Type II toxin-antitoxin system RelE/ParE family toxin n=1 Tax=Duganella aceris TaxID=2703883 RepID=A0ABX0FEN8_9BURK|nr:type II toxin-antitoxin system RelE/ParE family toxin [Duganella aceris]NGZ83003.1 type II toxin-antitoxin system RelE/ParE family toxin [Duganella aceris]
MRRIAWSRQAIRDMASIGRHIAADSPANAGKLLDQILAKIIPLATYPKIGRIGGKPGTRELVVHTHYLVIYRVLPDSITILRIKHVARKWPV